MEIIEEPETKRECPFCGAEFSFDERDIYQELSGPGDSVVKPPHVVCPFCKGKVHLNNESESDPVGPVRFGDTDLGENLGCAAMILAVAILIWALNH